MYEQYIEIIFAFLTGFGIGLLCIVADKQSRRELMRRWKAFWDRFKVNKIKIMKQFCILLLSLITFPAICQKIHMINDSRNEFEVIIYKNDQKIYHHIMRPKDELTFCVDLKDDVKLFWKRLTSECDKIRPNEDYAIKTSDWHFPFDFLPKNRRTKTAILVLIFPKYKCPQA